MTDEPIRGLLASLPPGEAEDLLAAGRRRTFPQGAFIFREGETPGAVVVLTAGRVKVSHTTAAGDEVVLAVRGPGDVLGELSALDGSPRSATVTAFEDVEAVIIPLGVLQRTLLERPHVAVRLLQELAGRLRDADRKRVEFAAFSTETRVTLRLLELADVHATAMGEVREISLPLTQEDLAAWVGSSREAVAKALRTLREASLIETGRRRITVLNVGELRARLP